MICPNCEKEIESNIPQCPHCGCRFPVIEQPKPPVVATPTPPLVKPQENVAQNTTISSMTWNDCPFCKQTISPTASFCKHCGAKIIVKKISPETTQQTTKTCPNCNKEINIAATFCKWCGTKCT